MQQLSAPLFSRDTQGQKSVKLLDVHRAFSASSFEEEIEVQQGRKEEIVIEAIKFQIILDNYNHMHIKFFATHSVPRIKHYVTRIFSIASLH